MQKKLLSLILITTIVSSCSKGSNKDSAPSQTNPTQNEASKNPNELNRKVIYFDTNSSSLSKENINILKQDIKSYLSSNKKLVIVAEGHCDERGSAEHNFKLGKKRANAVKKILVKSGVKSSRISVVSFGENKPVDTNHDENAWLKNRRVEVILLK